MAETALAVVERTKQAIAERGIAAATWNVMMESLYPGANPASVLLVWDYCQARQLDPLKKPVHIVPMKVKQGEQEVWRDVVLPGIYEYRITAHRTGEYLGHDEPTYGPAAKAFSVEAPEWCKFTVYRWNEKAKLKVPYTVTAKFAEVCGTKWSDRQLVANGRWQRAPVQMLTKCAEAAALREAFPEEIGGTPTEDEIADHMPEVIDVTGTVEAKPAAENPSLVSFMKVDEPIRDACEKGFAALKMSPAQRIMRINQAFGPEKTGQAVDEIGMALLEELKDAFAAQQGRPREKTSNAKKRADAGTGDGGATEAARHEAAPSAATEGKPVAGKPDQAQTSGGAGADSGGGAPAGEVVKGEPIKSADIPWGGAKAATNPKGASEYF